MVEPAPVDCPLSRRVQARVLVPVETALGLSRGPAWLDGYGRISAATCRLLLVDAELRQVCAEAGTGEVVDLTAGVQRPPPTSTGRLSTVLVTSSCPTSAGAAAVRVPGSRTGARRDQPATSPRPARDQPSMIDRGIEAHRRAPSG